jgi:hypothetical protein
MMPPALRKSRSRKHATIVDNDDAVKERNRLREYAAPRIATTADIRDCFARLDIRMLSDRISAINSLATEATYDEGQTFLSYATARQEFVSSFRDDTTGGLEVKGEDDVVVDRDAIIAKYMKVMGGDIIEDDGCIEKARAYSIRKR